MTTTAILIKRNVKLFFRDKGMFFTSLITPLILLVLYTTFLGDIYRDAFLSSFPTGFTPDETILNGLVGGQLFSSLLAVSCVTVAFSSNLLMVQDKVTGARTDLLVSPVKRSSLAIAYCLSSMLSTLLICLSTLLVGCIYLAFVGWYLSVLDLLWILLDVFLLVVFGTSLASVVNVFLHTQGQMSAVGSIVSSCYGFVCGAYMPISNLNGAIQSIVALLPGTYGTALLRNHSTRGALEALQAAGLPDEGILEIRNAIDCNVYLFGEAVPTYAMLLILCGAISVLLGAYVWINKIKK